MRDSEPRSRAQEVRRRRKQEAGKRLSDSAVLATRPVAPITARTSLLQAGHARARPVARRRSEAALSIRGIEVRMPTISFSDPGAKWRFVSFGVTLLLGAALYLAATAPAFRATGEQVIGNKRLASEEIGAVLATGDTPVFMLAPAELDKPLRLNFPDLLAAKVNVEAVSFCSCLCVPSVQAIVQIVCRGENHPIDPQETLRYNPFVKKGYAMVWRPPLQLGKDMRSFEQGENHRSSGPRVSMADSKAEVPVVEILHRWKVLHHRKLEAVRSG